MTQQNVQSDAQTVSDKAFYTIGYGGRAPRELVELLVSNGVKTLVDVRLRPDRASMGAYVKAKTDDKGIQKLLSEAGIVYLHLQELGNPWVRQEDWPERYERLMQGARKVLLERLEQVQQLPFCLMCAEKKVEDCHRAIITRHLEAVGYSAIHLL